MVVVLQRFGGFEYELFLETQPVAMMLPLDLRTFDFRTLGSQNLKSPEIEMENVENGSARSNS